MATEKDAADTLASRSFIEYLPLIYTLG